MSEPEHTPIAPPGDAPGASFLDPDVMLAFLYALVLEALDFFPVVGSSVSFILGIPLIAWMVWKSKSASSARKALDRRSKQQMERAVARRGARRALRRSILTYAVEGIPIVSIFPFWIFSIIMTVRQSNS